MNDIFKRRSVRSYLDKDVSMDIVKEMLYSAMQAPSAMNQVPWDFIVVEKKDVSKLFDCSHGALNLKECDKAVIFVMRKDVKCPEFLEQDMSAAIMSFMYAGYLNNVGTLWVGTYPHEERVNYLRNLFKINDPFIPYAIVGLGYPKENEAFKFREERIDESRIHIGKW